MVPAAGQLRRFVDSLYFAPHVLRTPPQTDYNFVNHKDTICNVRFGKHFHMYKDIACHAHHTHPHTHTHTHTHTHVRHTVTRWTCTRTHHTSHATHTTTQPSLPGDDESWPHAYVFVVVSSVLSLISTSIHSLRPMPLPIASHAIPIPDNCTTVYHRRQVRSRDLHRGPGVKRANTRSIRVSDAAS